MATGPSSPFTSSSQQRVGSYQFVAEISTAVLGNLWAAWAGIGQEAGRVVVGRRIDVAALPAGAAERIEAAARAAAKLRDPSLAAALDVVRTKDELVVVSEYVDGESLASIMHLSADKRMPIPVPVALRMANDLLTSLRAARNAWTSAVALKGPENVALLSAVYGGLSPEHVFVANYGDAVLTEVGVTGVAVSLPKIGRHPAVLAYRAPEQLNSAQADERTDIFSLGVVLWEMLAARPLFGDANRYAMSTSNAPAKPGEASSVAERLRDKPVPRLDTLERSGTPIAAQVADIVERCLERVPAQRYQTLEEAQQAIQLLGDDLIATPEQVSIYVDRLARQRIDERRRAISVALRVTRGDSRPPGSKRNTLRPDSPDSSPISDPAFPDSERPTLHHVVDMKVPSPVAVPPPLAAIAALVPAPPKPVTSKPPPPPRRSPFPAIAAVEDPVTERMDSPLSPLGTEVPVQMTSIPAPPAKSSRAVVLVLAIAALVGASVGALILVKNRSSAAEEGRRPAKSSETVAESTPASALSQTPTSTAAPTADDSAAAANVPATAASEEPAAAPSSETPARPARAGSPRRPSAAGPTRPSDSSKGTKGAFRPSGI